MATIDMAIEPETTIVSMVVVGDLTYDDMTQAFDGMLRDPRFRPGMNIMWDLRGAKLHAEPGDPTRLTMHVRANRERRGANYRVAAVVDDPQAAALVQVYKALAATLAFEVQAFHTVEEARTWLAAPTRETG